MQHTEFHLLTNDGLKLFAQDWQPAGRSRAVVCLIHGLGEHSSRYAHLASYLVQSGYAVAAFDLRGHGRSEGRRGHAPSLEAYLEDIDLFLEEVSRRHPEMPCFLYGHSLGGVLVLDYVLRRRPQIAGVIASAPGLRTALHEQTMKVILARILGTILPRVSLNTGLDPSSLSRDPEVVRKYQKDPLVHDRMTFRMGKDALAATSYVLEHAKEFPPVPLLVIHGTADRLAYPKGSREFTSQVTGEVTLKFWDGLYHEMHNEPEQEEVFAFLVEWLNHHVK